MARMNSLSICLYASPKRETLEIKRFFFKIIKQLRFMSFKITWLMSICVSKSLIKKNNKQMGLSVWNTITENLDKLI